MRGFALTFALILVAGVLVDPYTLQFSGSDYIRPGPTWQLVLGVADVALLAAVGLLSWRRQFRRAASLLVVELVFALSSAIVLIARDSLGRFTHGIGDEQYASHFLAWIGLLVLLFASLYHAASSERAHTG